jgi:DNA topoisomerase-2
MAQNFVGSNNINILKPNGQFGTILRGGKDAASPRYIWTKFEDLTTKIFMVDDEPILTKQYDDGMPIEPEIYAPIIPMILINGTKGIGTGFSTTIPPFNPKDIVKSIRNKIKGKSIETLKPWWQGFTGIITDNKTDDNLSETLETSYTVSGKWKIKDNKLIITELPIGEWTSDYKEFLEKMLQDEQSKKVEKKEKKDNPFKGYIDNNTDTKVYFELEFEDGYLEELDSIKIEKMFHLNKRFSLGNMHLYNYNGTITRYDTIYDIINEFYDVRLELYQKRKDNKLENLEYQLKLINWKVKFILMIINKKLEINNKKKSEIEEKLIELKFIKIEDSYNYLLSMPIYNLTQEKIEELKKQEKEKQTEYDTLVKMKPQDLWLTDLDDFENAYDSWTEAKKEKENNNVSQKKVKKAKK